MYDVCKQSQSRMLNATSVRRLAAVQLVGSDDELKQAALKAATTICKHNQSVTRQIKQMQHTSLQYDVDAGLEYEARVAVDAYSKMAHDPGTRKNLASKFAARSKL